MDRDRWRRLEPLLDEALELSLGQRDEWLQALRRDSPTLAEELGALLDEEASAEESGFLDSSVGSQIATSLVVPHAGATIGGYTLDRAIGRGGMGTVWLARRVDGHFEGTVAIKLLHHALLDARGPERFRREGSLLARLAHPGIARLLDAGVTAGGQPYLVLEHVDGMPIDVYARARRLTVTERLQLVLQVLGAVAHAHERLIVHRDLKPSNILVADDGTAKLLDFGIAKLLDDDAAHRTGITADGRAPLTPEFAAPEQLRGDMVTTATDVFAVGVLTYHLLVGRPPFDVVGRAIGDIARVVGETEAVRPSVACADPAIAHELRGDVDAIVLKAMHRDPSRRYASAEAFADDVRRLLDGHPVLARPDSAGYRIGKFVRRHRPAVALAGVAAALVVAAGLREFTLRGRAEAEARKARAVERYLVGVFDVADPYAAHVPNGRPEVPARALLERGAAGIDSALAGQPDVQAELRVALGRVYADQGQYDDAARLLRRALADRRAVFGPRHPAVAEAMDGLGLALMGMNRYDQAEPLLTEALAQRRALLGAGDTATAQSLDHVATLLQERGSFDRAEPLFREAVSVKRAVYGPEHLEVASELNNLATLLFMRGDYDAAEPLSRQAIAIDARWLGENHPRTADALHNLAQIQWSRGRYAEAETLYRRALAAKRRTLGDLHPSVTANLNNLGLLLAHELGRPEEAERLIREALALDRRMFGERHSSVAEGMRNLGTVLRLRGDFDGAERIYRQTLALNQQLFGGEHVRVAKTLAALAQVRYQRGDVAGSIPLYRDALGQFERLLGARHRNTVETSVNLARSLRERGDAVGAERLLRGALARLDTTSVAQRPLLLLGQTTLGDALADQRRALEAVPMLERALAASRARWGDGDWRTAETRVVLARCLAATGRAERAAMLLADAADVAPGFAKAQPRLAARIASARRRGAAL